MNELKAVSVNDSYGKQDIVGQNYPNFVNRMLFERIDLQEKIDKLDNFIDGDKFNKLPEMAQDLLIAQYNAMIAYLEILEIRIKFEGVKL